MNSELYSQDVRSLLGQAGYISSAQEIQLPSFMQERITIHAEQVRLGTILAYLEREGSIKFSYGDNVVDENKRYTVHQEDATLIQALTSLFIGTEIDFMPIPGGYVVLKRRGVDFEMIQGLIQGTITDATTGETLPGANVLVEGTTIGASADADGQYSFSVEPGEHTLVASFIGFRQTTRQIQIDEGQELTVDFALQPSQQALDELVVIGYGQQERSQLTGAISSVGRDEIREVSSSGLQGALQGRIAGVNVTPQDGRPGGQMDIDIRGVGTFGNNNPLYVIDGVPIFNDRDGGGYYGEGGNSNPLASLNPNDIESVEILKDASAAAIYGARAANGVVLVTTRGGHDGAPVFSVDIKRGVTEMPEDKFIPMMNTEQFIDFTIEAYQNAGLPLPISMQEPYLSDNRTRDTDWQDAAFDPAPIATYNFGVSGGNETARYAFNGGYTDEEGTLINTGFQRYSARMNTDFTISDAVEIGGSLNMSRSTWNGLYNPTIDFIQEIVQSAPTQPIYDEDNFGGFAGPHPEYSPVNRDNKVGRFALLDHETEHNRLIGSAYFEYHILDNLSYRINLSGDIARNSDYTFDPRYDMDNRSNNSADLDESASKSDSYVIENTLTWQQTFGEVHDVTMLVGYTQQESKSRWVSAGISDFPSNDTRVIAAGEGSFGVGGSMSEWGLVSQLGRINYSYDDTYNLMATVRRDGSSRFGADNQYGVFPSVSGSWNISNESFFEDVGGISDLRLRASWGQVGSQGIGNYAARSGITPGITYILGTSQNPAPAATYTGMGNSELKWETTTQTNIGVDVGLLDGDLRLTADYYVKNTEDVLLRVPIASSSGIGRDDGPFVNAGSLSNKGFEFEADYQNNIGELNYSVSGNIATNKNEVKSLGTTGGEPIIHSVQVGWATATMTTITRPGEPMGQFYGYVAEGTFRDQAEVDNHATQEAGTAPGDVKFRDLNDDGVINIEDKTIIGDPFPDFTYGFNVNMNYRNFDLGIFLQGKQGHDIYNLTWADLNTTPQYNNQTTMMLDRWTPNNRDTDVPRAIKDDPNNNNRVSTRFVEDGSYLRIQNLQLGYTFGPEVLNAVRLSRLRIFASVKNLYTFTSYRGYNPEIGELETGARSSLSRGVDLGVYPIPRVIEGGLEIYF